VTDAVTISRPYAEAAYKIASEEKKLDGWSKNLSSLSSVIVHGSVKAIIASPKISSDKTLDFLNSFLSENDPLFSNFISIMIENKKIYYIDEVYRLYREMILDVENITIVEVETAFPLTDDQKIKLGNMLEKKHDKKIEIEETINQNLLAGIKISIDNEVTDFSVKHKLGLMKEQITTNR
tara:strand:+ start:69 stop:608 length:540 start_codon:yes stop_codon:yes gene_type:complete